MKVLRNDWKWKNSLMFPKNKFSMTRVNVHLCYLCYSVISIYNGVFTTCGQGGSGGEVGCTIETIECIYTCRRRGTGTAAGKWANKCLLHPFPPLPSLNRWRPNWIAGPGPKSEPAVKTGVTWSRKLGFKMAATELGYLLTKSPFWLSLWHDISISWHGGKEL